MSATYTTESECWMILHIDSPIHIAQITRVHLSFDLGPEDSGLAWFEHDGRAHPHLIGVCYEQLFPTQLAATAKWLETLNRLQAEMETELRKHSMLLESLLRDRDQAPSPDTTPESKAPTQSPSPYSARFKTLHER